MPLRPNILFVALMTCFLNAHTCLFVLAADESDSTPVQRLLLKPGEALVTGMKAEDIVVTYDIPLAKEQVAAYPDSPEASFVLAVALTRTSMVEDALKEVRRARKLAEKKGGPAYFDHMISAYEEMLKSYPNENRVRYGLAWAYYMKAYVLTHYAKSVMPKKPANSSNTIATTNSPATWHKTWVESLAKTPVQPVQPDACVTAQGNFNPWADMPPELVPQVKSYYEAALSNLDQLLAKEPTDTWARAYRAFLNAEYTGNLQQAMGAWKDCLGLSPNNPAPYFFLGESYLQQGNLKECLHNISKAVAVRNVPSL